MGWQFPGRVSEVVLLPAVIGRSASNAVASTWVPPVAQKWQAEPDGYAVSVEAFTDIETSEIIKWAKMQRPAGVLECANDYRGLQGQSSCEAISTGRYRQSERSRSQVWDWSEEKANDLHWISDRLRALIYTGNELMWSFDGLGTDNDLHVQIALYEGDRRDPGYYGWHTDTSLEHDRVLSATVQLSAPDAYQGGSLQLSEYNVSRVRGLFTLFPSYVMHRVHPVLAGERFALVAWLSQRRTMQNDKRAHVGFSDEVFRYNQIQQDSIDNYYVHETHESNDLQCELAEQAAFVLEGNGEYAAAIDQLKVIVKKSDDGFPHCQKQLYDHLGRLHVKVGSLRRAAASFRTALDIDPQFAPALSNLGTVLVQVGRLKKAEERLSTALLLDPTIAEAHKYLGKLFKKRGVLWKAMSKFEDAMHLVPEDAEVYKDLSSIHFEWEDFTAARRNADKALQLDPMMAEALVIDGRIHVREGHLPRARSRFEDAVVIDPAQATTHAELGLVFMKEKEFRHAKRTLKRAIRLDPMLADFHNNLAGVHMEMHDMVQAKIAIDTALMLDPMHGGAHNKMGIWQVRARQPLEAYKCFQLAVKLTPWDASARQNLDRLHQKLKSATPTVNAILDY